MFAETTKNVGFAQRVVATLVACAMVMASYGFYTTAQAANLTNISDVLSDSNPSAQPSHTISFTVPTGSSIGVGELIHIDFEAGFTNVASTTSGDLTVTVDGTPATIGSFAATVQRIEFDLGADSAAADDVVVVAIDEGVITSPGTVQSYEITVETDNDLGRTRVAIVDNVLVTAIVDTAFEFIVTGLATSSGAINGDDTTGSTTATEMPFGTLTAENAEVLGQQLNVTTNARNGFSVTVQTDGDLRSSTGAVIDNFVEGSDVAVSGTAWASPVTDVNDETTWGHWGLTSDDTDLADELVTGTSYIAASTSPREVFSHDGPSDGLTQDIGEAKVAYQIEITALQEAADDYQTTLTYVATPTF